MNDIFTDVILPLSVFLVMIGLGMTLKLADFTRIKRYPRAFAVGVVSQLILLPLLAFLTVSLFRLDGALAIGLLVIACCPGGVVSNLFTYIARGDVGLSVSLTAGVGMISPITMPIIIAWSLRWQGLDGEGFELPYWQTLGKLVFTCVLPVPIGMYLRRFLRAEQQNINLWVSRFSTFVVIALILLFCQKVGLDSLWSYIPLVGLACIFLNIMATLAGAGVASVARLHSSQKVSIGLEVGIQNAAVAYMVAMSLMKNVDMAIAPSVYGLWMSVPALIIAWVNQRRVKLFKDSQMQPVN